MCVLIGLAVAINVTGLTFRRLKRTWDKASEVIGCAITNSVTRMCILTNNSHLCALSNNVSFRQFIVSNQTRLKCQICQNT